MAMKSTVRWHAARAVMLVGLTAIFAAALTGERARFAAESQTYKSPNPVSGDANAIKQGKRLYRGMCARCHGRNGQGSARFADVKNLREYSRGYSKFASIVTGGRKKMPAWGGILSGDDINKIGAFLETLALDGADWRDPS